MTDPTRLNVQPKSGYPGFSDTDPTPERRWALNVNAWSGKPEFRFGTEYRDTKVALATLNEAETMRAELHRKTTALTVAVAFAEEVRTERDEARERVRVLEDALTEIQSYGSSVPLGMTEAMFDAAAARDMKRIAVRALAGAEPPAPAMDTTDGAFDRVYGPGSKRAGADGGERRG